MIRYLKRIIDSNYFFVSLISFVMVLPFSQALVSILSGFVLFTALVEDSLKNKLKRFKRNKFLILIPVVYAIYIFSTLISGKIEDSLYDLNKTLFFLVLPLAFLFGKELSSTQKRHLFYGFGFAIIVSTVVAILNWRFFEVASNFSVHKVSLVSHIRFSFQLIMAFWFFIFIIQKNFKKINALQIVIFAGLAAYFLIFLLFQQSLTGIVSLLSSTIFFLIVSVFQVQKKYRLFFLITVMVLIALPIVYVTRAINKFYNFEKVDKEKLERTTQKGNLYWHDFDNKSVENGHFVYLYICDEEVRAEWNKRSELKYDSIAKNGYPVHSTLIRYLTSKGLRKDAEGIKALNSQDIRNIENCIANYIFQGKKFSLYPRIYQTIWEYYVYSTTGIADYQSFSKRVEFGKAAITIIKKNFLLGVGTANWRDEFKNAFISNGSKLSEEQYGSSHNQYLNYMVKFGIIGTLLILFLLVYPIIRTKKYKDLLFIIFLVFMFFANFADSNLESHMGSAFFVVFYCIFMTGGDQYLCLNNDENSTNRFHL